MAKKEKPNGQHAPPAAGNNSRIPYDEAVAEDRDIIANIEKMDGEQRRHQMRLGYLADRVETKYRDHTVAKFAQAIGVGACTLKRYLSVYRAWDGMGKEAPGPVSYAVLRALQDQPDREAIVKEKPKITKSEAQEIMRERKRQQNEENNGKDDWKAEGRKRWLRHFCSVANKQGRDAEEVMGDEEELRRLQEIAEPATLAAAVADLEVQLKFAKRLQHPAERIAKAERKKPRFKEAEGVAA
jgi:hypothetical protein